MGLIPSSTWDACSIGTYKAQLALRVFDSRGDAAEASAARTTSLNSGATLQLRCLSRFAWNSPLRHRWSSLPRTLVIAMRQVDQEGSVGLRLGKDRSVIAILSPVAESAGWRVGDILVAVGLELVHSQEEAVRAISSAKLSLQLDDKPMTFLVQRPAPLAGAALSEGVLPVSSDDPYKQQRFGGSVIAVPEFWRAQIVPPLPPQLEKVCPGGWCLLQTASSPEERTQAMVTSELDILQDIAELAGRFNRARERAVQNGSLPDIGSVQVCVPVGAVVTGCRRQEVALPDDAVMIHPYPDVELEKFVCSGSQVAKDKCEPQLAHEFFHYSAWASAGQKLVWDLQGKLAEEGGGGVVFVNPAMIKASADLTVSTLLEATMPSSLSLAGSSFPSNSTSNYFGLVHPTCAPFCASFDPGRNAARGGLCKPCGLNCM